MVWKDKHGREEIFVHPDILSGKAGKAQFRITSPAPDRDASGPSDGPATDADTSRKRASAEQKNRRPPKGVPPTLAVQSQ